MIERGATPSAISQAADDYHSNDHGGSDSVLDLQVARPRTDTLPRRSDAWPGGTEAPRAGRAAADERVRARGHDQLDEQPSRRLPGALAAFAKALPVTHAMALMRYGFVDHKGTGLHDIWGLHSTAAEAWLSLAVVVAFTAALSAVAVRSFTRAAVS